MVKSSQMRPRSSLSIGVLLCTCFSPLPLQEGSNPPKIILVNDPPKFPDLDDHEWYKDFVVSEKYGYMGLSLLYKKPVSWFLRKEIPLCSVPTIPYGHGRVHKPPWV